MRTVDRVNSCDRNNGRAKLHTSGLPLVCQGRADEHKLFILLPGTRCRVRMAGNCEIDEEKVRLSCEDVGDWCMA